MESTRENTDSLRESILNSSSSSSENIILMGEEGKGEEGFFNGDTLSQAYKKTYGFDWDHIPATVFEVVELDRYKDVMEIVAIQKIYHLKGLVRRFEEQGITRYKVERVQEIMIQRKMLKPIAIPGQAKSTFGLIIICTPNCSQGDIDDYLQEFYVGDKLRFIKEQQRSKKKTSIGEQKQIWKDQSEAAKSIKEDELEILHEKTKGVMCEHNQHKDVCQECFRERILNE